MFLTAQAALEFVVISRFRRRYLKVLMVLFTQVLGLCGQRRAGVAGQGRVGRQQVPGVGEPASGDEL